MSRIHSNNIAIQKCYLKKKKKEGNINEDKRKRQAHRIKSNPYIYTHILNAQLTQMSVHKRKKEEEIFI